MRTQQPTRHDVPSHLRAVPLLAAVALAGLLSGCWGNRSDVPPVHIIWNMDFQDKWDPQEKVSFFADGRAMRPPVEGTVARGQLKDDDLLWRGRGFDGRFADQLPESIKLDAKLLERGRERYDIYCAVCHNATGDGDGMIVRRGFTRPPSFHIDRLRQAPDQHYYNAITNGFGAMYSYSDRIAPDDRWAITAYIRVLQLSQAAEVAKLPAEDQEKIKQAAMGPTTKPAGTPATH